MTFPAKAYNSWKKIKFRKKFKQWIDIKKN